MRACVLSHGQLCNPMGYSLPGSSAHGIFPGENTGVGYHFPTPGDLPDPEIKPMSLMSPALAGGFFTTSATWEAGERDKDNKPQDEQALGCMMN